jgi:predicted SAM-dependent methyltransferase
VAAASCSDVYASHVLEHVGYNGDVLRALKEMHRVLRPGGRLRLSVPDLDVLCKLWLDPALSPAAHFEVMRMIYGGRTDEHDVHHAGFNYHLLAGFLTAAGFVRISRVADHREFRDTSTFAFLGKPISLNIEGFKP